MKAEPLGTSYLALPDGAGPFPGVVVVHEAFGLNDNIRDICARFAGEGYAALGVDLFAGRGRAACMARMFAGMMAGNLEHYGVRALKAALGQLGGRPEVDAGRIGAIGFCLGGSIVLTWACTDNRLAAIAPFYAMAPRPREAIRRLCPVVGSWPGRDITTRAAGVLETRLTAAGVPHDLKVYPGARHSFFNDQWRTYDSAAAADSWRRILAFFAEHVRDLRPSPSPAFRPCPRAALRRTLIRMDYAERPMLVFWETTRACLLACRHCRASATTQAPPGELTTAEGHRLIEQVAGFGRPHPILVLTGGDCLLRPDLFDLTWHATSLGVPVCLSPSVTPLLDAGLISRIAASGVKAVSVSLDGASAGTHDGVRGIPGHFGATTAVIRDLVSAGVKVQVNTTVMTSNVAELADVAALLVSTGAQMWEVFFLVQVGRGQSAGAISAAEHGDVCHFLYDASRYGFVVRTVEAPFFRRTVLLRREGCPPPDTALYTRLTGRLRELLGPPARQPSAHTAATRDGKGIMFISSTGDVYPAGFLPLSLGNVRHLALRDIYTGSPLLRDIRAARFAGRCGRCEYADLCGGSRARAYAATGDPLGEDPACAYRPPTRLAGARG
jgi:radical SAM protein